MIDPLAAFAKIAADFKQKHGLPIVGIAMSPSMQARIQETRSDLLPYPPSTFGGIPMLVDPRMGGEAEVYRDATEWKLRRRLQTYWEDSIAAISESRMLEWVEPTSAEDSEPEVWFVGAADAVLLMKDIAETKGVSYKNDTQALWDFQAVHYAIFVSDD